NPPDEKAPVAALSAEARALLASVQRLLFQRDARPNESVLTFKDDAAMQRFLARAGKAGLAVLGQVDALRSVRVRFEDLKSLQRDVLANADDYAAAAGNALMHIPQPPAREERAALDQVPFGNRTLDFLGATGDRSQWGRGNTIAILDTGVSGDATFGAGRLRTLDIGLGTAPESSSAREGGHGTAVAALAAGASPDAGGVAPGANLLSIRVTDANGTSDIFTVAHAIVAAVDAGAKIVNVSLGGYATNATLDAALTYATERGALIVAAAGNDQAAQLTWPAADPRVVSVGAIDAAEQQVAFSNSGAQLQLTAPGYGVQTAWLNGQRVYIDGTSASSPLVAGAIAAVMSRNPSLTPQQAAQLLARTASDGGAPGVDPAFGHGILNLGWALNSANPGYVDTAVSSHFYDAASNQMQIVVQNRSGRAVTGLALNVTAGTLGQNFSVPPLAPGESYVAKMPVDSAALRNSGSLNYLTVLSNPIGVTDQVPANNRKTSVLTPAPRPPGGSR
ncbi:MAG TPA: S8 family serine peptidase, partial [Opitutaceae bacterium]|nr:S8 family serine peptidase [Opitutaceae bacterium]